MPSLSPIGQARWDAIDNALNILLDRQRVDEKGSLYKGMLADLLG